MDSSPGVRYWRTAAKTAGSARLFVSFGGGHDTYFEATHLIDLVIIDREHDLLEDRGVIRPSNEFRERPRKSRVRGSAVAMSRSKNSYMRSPRRALSHRWAARAQLDDNGLGPRNNRLLAIIRSGRLASKSTAVGYRLTEPDVEDNFSSFEPGRRSEPE